MTKIAGPDEYFWGNDNLAVHTQLDHPTDITLGPDGSLYIADTGANLVRRVDLNGFIHTIAGTGAGPGPTWANGDGGPATQAAINGPLSVAVAPDGGCIFSKRGASAGLAPTKSSPPWWGIPTIMPHILAMGRRHSDWVIPGRWYHVRDPIRRSIFRRIILGSITPAHESSVPRRSCPVSHSDFAIPSSDGNQVYQFNALGRHLRTLDALTGVALYTFAYDPAGQLASVTDRDGLVTRIERDAAGNPTAIIRPMASAPR